MNKTAIESAARTSADSSAAVVDPKPAGYDVVRFSAMKHGILSRYTVLSHENHADHLRDGDWVNHKLRDPDEKRDMQQAGGAEPCLFGRRLIKPNARIVAFAEGELNAMTLHQCGVPTLDPSMCLSCQPQPIR